MTDRPIVVASAVDRGFLPFVEVVAASIAASATTDRPVEYHVLYAGPSTWIVGHLRRFRRGPVTVHVHEMDNPWEKFGTINGYPPSTFLRLSLEDALPAHVERVIYLDVDLVVRSDLGPLYDTPLNGHPIAATVDWGMAYDVVQPDGQSALAYVRDTLELGDAADLYFQCGIMVIDLPTLRRMNYQTKVAAAVERFGLLLRYADQCAANHVLKGDYQPLNGRWNVFSWSAREGPDPWIIHYAGSKPWKRVETDAAEHWWKVARTLPTFPMFAWGYLHHRVAREIAALKRRIGRRLKRD
jgi:lipopolysaccharide biosynthesis glycosyltransferase